MSTEQKLTNAEHLAKRARFLPNKKVTLMPVPRLGGLINDPKHKAFFMYPDTSIRFYLPYNLKKGCLEPILNDEEVEFFQEELGTNNISFYKLGKDNFWSTFFVEIRKNDLFMDKGETFDLSNPKDNLKVRVLKAQEIVSPDWDSRFEKGEYRFALIDEGYMQEKKVKLADLNIAAYKAFSKIESSKQKMYDFLCVAYMQLNMARRVPIDATQESLKGMVQDLIDSDVDGFLSVANDSTYDAKLAMYKALSYNFIVKDTLSKDYIMSDTKQYLGKSVDEVIGNLRNPEYQEHRLRIEALLATVTPKA